MGGNASGHRTVPHTADLRIEAWAPTRGGCIGQAVLGAVDLDEEAPVDRVAGDSDGDLLVAALEEVIYLLDTTGQAPVGVEVGDADGGIEMALEMADASALSQVGAVPKAVALNDLELSHSEDGWRCSVTLDV